MRLNTLLTALLGCSWVPVRRGPALLDPSSASTNPRCHPDRRPASFAGRSGGIVAQSLLTVLLGSFLAVILLCAFQRRSSGTYLVFPLTRQKHDQPRRFLNSHRRVVNQHRIFRAQQR